MVVLLVLISALAVCSTTLLILARIERRRFNASLANGARPSQARWRFLGEAAHAVERMRLASAGHAERIERERLDYLRVLGTLDEGLVIIDRQRRVVWANERFTEMTSASAPVDGRPLRDVVRAAGIYQVLDTALAGRESSERVTVSTGVAERSIDVHAFPLSSDHIAAAAIFIDVTHVERLEKLRRNFIADFSHEVRTPLAALTCAVESYEIGTGRITADEDQHLRRVMGRQLRRLERLVNDLSELSTIESGDVSLEPAELDLRSLVAELCEDFAERALMQGVTIELTGPSVLVRADALRIQQAFSNLIDNALKYGGPGAPIEVDVALEGESAVVRVTDHGEGIASDEKERIFRRFYRIDKSRSQEITGSGLGLAITKHLLLLHRGTIEVESEMGRGTTFVVSLPLSRTAGTAGDRALA